MPPLATAQGFDASHECSQRASSVRKYAPQMTHLEFAVRNSRHGDIKTHGTATRGRYAIRDLRAWVWTRSNVYVVSSRRICGTIRVAGTKMAWHARHVSESRTSKIQRRCRKEMRSQMTMAPKESKAVTSRIGRPPSIVIGRTNWRRSQSGRISQPMFYTEFDGPSRLA